MSKLGFLLALLCLGLGCRSKSATEESRGRIEALETENAELRGQVDSLETRLAVLLQASGYAGIVCHWDPPIDALVLEVNEDLHRIVIDKGRGADVKVGYVFDIYRGAVYKGHVRIEDVEEDRSSGVILSEKNAIEPGDSASTVL